MEIERNTKPVLFSILVANYNNGKFFKDCYQSIINQTYKNWEVILVDDGSTDNSLELIKNLIGNDSRFKLYTNETNKGCGFAKRKCVKLANGVFCGFLDPDDAITEDALEVSLDAYTSEKTIATYSKITFCDKHLEPLFVPKQIKPIINNPFFFNLPTKINHFFTFRKSTYDKTSGINLHLSSAVDQDLYLKLLEHGNAVHIPQNMYWYRMHSKGISQENLKNKAKENFAAVIHETMKRRHLKTINGVTIPEKYDTPQEIFDLLNYQTQIPFRIKNKIALFLQKFFK